MISVINRDPRTIQGEELERLRNYLLNHPNLKILDSHPLVIDAITHMRQKHITHEDYEKCVRRVTNLLMAEATKGLPTREFGIFRDKRHYLTGKVINVGVTLIPILRAGLPMLEEATRYLHPTSTGFIMAERDESTGKSEITTCKLPVLRNQWSFFLEQVIATGGTLAKAIEIAKRDYHAETILLLCCIAAPQGIARILETHPEVKIFLGCMDKTLDENFFVSPGIGDAGDKTFGVYHKPSC